MKSSLACYTAALFPFGLFGLILIMFDANAPRKPFITRGSSIERCPTCMLAMPNCICDACTPVELDKAFNVAFCLLMHKEESYKPTNTGRLIEAILPKNCQRFYWSRTEPDPDFLALLNNEAYQPYIIFPGDRGGYDERVVSHATNTVDKTVLFIILDGSWRQAGRMFRLSTYLQHLPVLPLTTQRKSDYLLRKAPSDFHLCTAEVAMVLLEQHGQGNAAHTLGQYFAAFNLAYSHSRRLPQ